MNSWETLRWCFTESELIYFGWNKAKVPVLALEPEQLWEHDARAPGYYQDRRRDLPPEVEAVVNEATAAGNKSST